MLPWLFFLRIEGLVTGYWPGFLIVLSAISLFLTQARPGIVGSAAVFMLVYACAVMRRAGIGGRSVTWSFRLFPLFGLFILALLLRRDMVAETIVDSVLNGHSETTIQASFYRSRGFLLERSWQNFKEHPLSGIGFGVASDSGDFKIDRDPLLGLVPTVAPVEKGVAPVAALEETGLVGSALLLVLLVSWLKPAFSRKAACSTAALGAGAFS